MENVFKKDKKLIHLKKLEEALKKDILTQQKMIHKYQTENIYLKEVAKKCTDEQIRKNKTTKQLTNVLELILNNLDDLEKNTKQVSSDKRKLFKILENIYEEK